MECSPSSVSSHRITEGQFSDRRVTSTDAQIVRSGLVSVIIPTYNRSDLVIGTMESVLRQSYRPIELVVVDDGSVDDTFPRLNQWKREHDSPETFDVCLLRQANRGAPAARNHGLRRSAGEFVQFLDSDCLLHPDKLSQQVALLGESEAGYCACITEFVDVSGRVKYSVGAAPGADALLEAVSSSHFTCIAPLWKRSEIASTAWDEDLACLQDWVFKARVLKKGAQGIFLPKPLCQAVLHEQERVSQHGSLKFVVGREKSILRAHSLIEQAESNAPALDHIGAMLQSVFKAFLKLGEFQRAQAALDRCMEISPSKSLKLRVIWMLNACLGPERLARVLRIAGRL